MKKKLIISVVCLLFITVFNFALPRLMPGDTALMLTGIDSELAGNEQYEYYYEKIGADKPLAVQFGDYIAGILRGDLGYSFHENENVSTLIVKRLPATLQIALPAIIISSLLAAVLGCMMGVRRKSPLRAVTTGAAIVCNALPSFLVALLLILLFSIDLGILPSNALNSVGYEAKGAMGRLADRTVHLILPVLTLVLANFPAKYLMVLNTVTKQLDEKYVIYAKSRGMSDLRIAFGHIFPNICQPFLTMVGMNFGFILSGSLVIENIFSIKGMGSLISQAIAARDYPVLQGVLFVCALSAIVFTLLTDIVTTAIDPKVRCCVHEAE